MIDTKTIELMTKIAIHDKRYNAKDKKISDYYRSDYIYRKNAINRISAVIGLFFVFLLVVLDMVYIKGIDIFKLDYKTFGTTWGVSLVMILVLYTIFGGFKYGKEYDEAQKRSKKYYSMLSKLDKQRTDRYNDSEKLDGGYDERNLPN